MQLTMDQFRLERMEKAMIELKNVTMKFEKEPVLSEVDLCIKKGSAFGLLGSNGAGKSTILRLMAGVYQQTAGEVLIDGERVYESVDVKAKIFFINDETVQFNRYTLLELKEYYRMFYPAFSETLFEQLRERIQLPLEKKIAQFSKGMKRQAIIIIGLACQPEYLLLDEAFDGLDPTMRMIVKRMIVDAMVDRKLTTVISSHNLKEIGEICDAIAMVHQGRVIFSKEMDEVNEQISKVQLAFCEPKELKDFEGLQVLHFTKNQSVINMIVKGDQEELNRRIEAMNPVIFDRTPLTLEEIFMYEMEGLGYEYSVEGE